MNRWETVTAHLRAHTLPGAFALLPERMAGRSATAMLLAIGLQESLFEHRKQIMGPARGFLQFEKGGGVAGVLAHPASAPHAKAACAALCYPAEAEAVYEAIAHNDTLAMVFGRLLLWTLPYPLPGPDNPQEGYRQYIAAWRPGRPHPATWPDHFAHAWAMV